MSKFIDLTGHKYGKLKVVSFARKKGQLNYWNCVCECGNKTQVSIGNLRFGSVKSCGCGSKGINLAEKNGMWKGNKVGYIGLHQWIKQRLPKPKLCQCCKKVPPFDLANISGKYKRNLSDWEWLCRKCHMKKDGRIKKLKKLASKKGIKNGRVKLTEKEVRRIKDTDYSMKGKELAKIYNVSITTINSIRTNRSWKHLIS